ncbi:MAG: ATP synthase F1 subunit epsilon [Planctomycetota bacterium]
METSFTLEVITPESIVYTGRVKELILPAIDGQIGVLANHAPLVTALAVGALQIKEEDGSERTMVVSDGFFEIANNHARVLADAGERAEDIDLSRAQAAEKRARKRLEEGENREIDFDRVRAVRSLQKALWRERVARKRGR